MTTDTCDDIPTSAGAAMTDSGRHKRAGSKRGRQVDRQELAERRHGLVAGRLPKGYRQVTVCVGQLRQGLERAVVGARGSIGLPDAASINTAARWESHSLLCLRQLRDHYAELSPVERAKLSEQSAAASARRDQAIERLDLGGAADFASSLTHCSRLRARSPHEAR